MKRNELKNVGAKLKMVSTPDFTQEQNEIILQAQCDLYLYSKLRAKQFKTCFPGATENGILNLRNGKYKIDLSKWADSADLVFQEKPTDYRGFHYYGVAVPADIEKVPELKGARHILLRLFSLVNPVDGWVVDDLKSAKGHPCMTEQEVWARRDLIAARHIAHHMKISEDIADEILLGNSSLQRSVVNFFLNSETEPGTTFIPFRMGNQVLHYTVMDKEFGGKRLLLPISAFIRGGDAREFIHYVMPSGSYPLFQLNRLVENDPRQVILTENLRLAVENAEADTGIFVTSFYGGTQAVPKTDFSPLYGRDVYFLLVNYPLAADSIENLRCALEVYQKLWDQSHDLKFLCPEGLKWTPADKDDLNGKYNGKIKNMVELPAWRFLELCVEAGLHVPKEYMLEKFDVLNISQLNELPDIQPLVSPLLSQGDFCTVYAGSAAGKSMLMMTLGMGVAMGAPMFGGKLHTDGKPRGTLYFSGEMSSVRYKKRVQRIMQEFSGKYSQNQNYFQLYNARGVDLSAEKHQEAFERLLGSIKETSPDHDDVELVIFDNWQSVTHNSDLPQTFYSFFEWISALQARKKLTVVVINHTDRDGKRMRGSHAMVMNSDMAIKLEPIHAGKGICSMLVHSTKDRDGVFPLDDSFVVTLNFNEPDSPWQVRSATPDELQRLRPHTANKSALKADKGWDELSVRQQKNIIKKAYGKETSAEIAAQYGVSTSTIDKFKKTHLLRDRDLKEGLELEDE